MVEGGAIPYQPWAAAQQQENYANRLTEDPARKCYLPGVPRITYMPFPFRILQTPDHVVITYEYQHAVRIIYTDGSPHPLPNDFWMGDSRGHWDGDTLVVDTTHFNGLTWFDAAGNFHSDQLHVVERYTPVTPYHVDYAVTIEDPAVFTRPWTMRMPLYRRMDEGLQLLDYDCCRFHPAGADGAGRRCAVTRRGIGFGTRGALVALAALGLLGPAALPAAVHAQGGAPVDFEPPRTPWGDPDFRGYYLPGASQPLETRASGEWRQEEGVNRGQGAAFSRFFEPDPDAPPRPAAGDAADDHRSAGRQGAAAAVGGRAAQRDHGPAGRAGPPGPARQVPAVGAAAGRTCRSATTPTRYCRSPAT